MKPYQKIWGPVLFLVFFCCACATKPDFSDNPSGIRWDISTTAAELGGDDPVEPFNRSMFEVNHFLMQWLVRPVSWVYCSVLPKEVIQRIDNVSDNLAFPGRMVSCLFQAKWKGAGISFSRFMINSTVGIAGIFDPADYYFGLKRRHENMGHAFAFWGIGPGCILILPFSSAVNVRDQIGSFFDSVLDLKIILPYAGSISGVNRTMNSYDSFHALVESAADPYEQFKLAMLLMRYPQLNDYMFPMEESGQDSRFQFPSLIPGENDQIIRTGFYYKPEHPLVDTLRSTVFSMQRTESPWWTGTSIWNKDFYNLGQVREITDQSEPEGTMPRQYQFWNEPRKENGVRRKNELVLIIPGVGTHYTGKMLRALAELYSDAGYAVAVTSNTMNWTFATTAETAFPGYIPEDVRHIRRHLRLILDDLSENLKFSPERIILAGYSLGALQTLHIAAEEEKEETLGISRYIAINPPADLLYAVTQFEKLGTVTESWTKEEYFRNLGGAVVNYLPVAQKKHPFQPVPDSDEPDHLQPDYNIRVTPDQAAAMIALSFRMVLRELMLSNARNGFLPEHSFRYSWGNRNNLYKTIDAIGVMEYVNEFVRKKHPDLTLEELGYRCSLYSIEPFLQSSSKIRVLHNLDDILISQKDADFLSETLGNRLFWFDHGAHLGNLYLKEYHKLLLELSGNGNENPEE